MNQRRFLFKKDLKNEIGTIKKGFELILFKDVFYLNGAMLSVKYQRMFNDLINNPRMMREYLEEVPTTPNRI